jgi:NAD(P)-dependent dehydrogenase (short-subunit alcohol dehydrogenase family)
LIWKICRFLITGGAGYIGCTVVQAFISAGAKASLLSIAYHEEADYPTSNLQEIHADISSEQSFNAAWYNATRSFGPVQTCITLGALDLSVFPHHETAADVPLERFRKTLEVNVLRTFLTARTWLRVLRKYCEH